MKELSLHILDIVQNSVAAGATEISLDLKEDKKADVLVFQVGDNGRGMSTEMVSRVTNPFVTGRTTRKVGLGIPLLRAAAELTGGGVHISSQEGGGTVIRAEFGYSHIDRQPLGNMAETVLGLITAYTEIDFDYHHAVDEKEYRLNTKEMRAILGGVALNAPDVVLWLSEYLNENETALYSV